MHRVKARPSSEFFPPTIARIRRYALHSLNLAHPETSNTLRLQPQHPKLPLAVGVGVRGLSVSSGLVRRHLASGTAELEDFVRATGDAVVVASSGDGGEALPEAFSKRLKAGSSGRAAAVLALPHSFEGAKKAALADATVFGLSGLADPLVLVDCDASTSFASLKAAANALLAAAAGVVAALLAVDRHVTSTGMGTRRTIAQRLPPLLAQPATFAQGAAPRNSVGNAAAAAAMTAALYAAASVPCLASVNAQRRVSCVALLRVSPPLPADVLDAGLLVLEGLFGVGCAVSIAQTAAEAVPEEIEASLLLFASPCAADQAVKSATPAETQRWSALSRLAGGVRATPGRARALRQPMLEAVSVSSQTPPPPQPAPEASTATVHQLEYSQPTEAGLQSSTPRWPWQRSEPSVSERANAVLARDRGVSFEGVAVNETDMELAVNQTVQPPVGQLCAWSSLMVEATRVRVAAHPPVSYTLCFLQVSWSTVWRRDVESASTEVCSCFVSERL